MIYLGHHVTLTRGHISTLTFRGHHVCICFGPAWRDKHDGTKIISLVLLYQNYVPKTIFDKLYNFELIFFYLRENVDFMKI